MDPVVAILSWNIFMMPLGQSPENEARASAIAAAVRDQGYDVLCFQKAFDDSAREAIEQILGDAYPHRYGPANDGCSLLVNSDVWVVSRLPLSDYHEIEFKNRIDVEIFSKKGALMLSGPPNGARPLFQLIATHLQGDDGPQFNPEAEAVRGKQLEQIRRELIAPYAHPGVPIIFCGGFNIPRGTPGYQHMLRAFDADNGPGTRITLDDRPGINGLGENGGRVEELDYVLIARHGAGVRGVWERRIFQRGGWDTERPERIDLSYRYAVGAKFTFAE